MSLFNAKWKYTHSEDMKPGYLAEKFRKIRAEQKKLAEAKAAATVQPFQRKKA